MPIKQRGRPAGYMLHTEAFEALIAGKFLKKAVAEAAGIAPGYLADLLAHRGGASREVVDALADALSVTPGAIFPELAGKPWTSPLPDRDAKRARDTLRPKVQRAA